jgi:hypothetical protein
MPSEPTGGVLSLKFPYAGTYLDGHFNPSLNISRKAQPHVNLSLYYFCRGRPSPTVFVNDGAGPSLCRVWPYSDNGPINHSATYLEINKEYNRHGLKSIQHNPEKGYNAWEYSFTLIQVASFGIYIMGFFTSLLSTIQRTIDNIYLKEVEASKLITYNNTQPPNQLERTMLDQVTTPTF